ncbi:hypothetical protein NPIL_26831 [Nephila pilipes]|uniref:Uncharacterized protein n=1 Tax=Nephila pilipes TaxID=299642 RepID=A0A8X6R242_NEPPI|nr:hypothetical protein NPIL_26831 [Nephila pilipes]
MSRVEALTPKEIHGNELNDQTARQKFSLGVFLRHGQIQGGPHPSNTYPLILVSWYMTEIVRDLVSQLMKFHECLTGIFHCVSVGVVDFSGKFRIWDFPGHKHNLVDVFRYV